jgi:hypothetical protein
LLSGADFRGQRCSAHQQHAQSKMNFVVQIASLNTAISLFAGCLVPGAKTREGILVLFSVSKLSSRR